MPSHVALLRGVNVGGARLPMADLRSAVTALGHADVATYVQSGNLVLTPTGRPAVDALAAELRGAVRDVSGIDTPVIVMTAAEWADVVAANPYPDEDDGTRLHAVVAQEPYSREQQDAAADVAARARAEGSEDELTIVGRVVYLHLPDGMGRSRLATLLGRSKGAAQHVATARNWRTVLALDRLLGG